MLNYLKNTIILLDMFMLTYLGSNWITEGYGLNPFIAFPLVGILGTFLIWRIK